MKSIKNKFLKIQYEAGALQYKMTDILHVNKWLPLKYDNIDITITRMILELLN